jgi:hypothetical protein
MQPAETKKLEQRHPSQAGLTTKSILVQPEEFPALRRELLRGSAVSVLNRGSLSIFGDSAAEHRSRDNATPAGSLSLTTPYVVAYMPAKRRLAVTRRSAKVIPSENDVKMACGIAGAGGFRCLAGRRREHRLDEEFGLAQGKRPGDRSRGGPVRAQMGARNELFGARPGHGLPPGRRLFPLPATDSGMNPAARGNHRLIATDWREPRRLPNISGFMWSTMVSGDFSQLRNSLDGSMTVSHQRSCDLVSGI